MPNDFDAVVIGAGSFGAWTALALRRRGLRVLLLDAHAPAHSRASSGGESRIIRMGYGPNRLYTEWSQQALERWQELFALAGRPLFHRTGVLWLSPAHDAYTAQSLAAFWELGVEHQPLTRAELARLYPQLTLDPAVTWGLLEPASGVLLARRAVATVVEQAVREGVVYQRAAVPQPVQFDQRPDGAALPALTLADGSSITFSGSATYVFACGAWLGQLFPQVVGHRIFPTRQEVIFFSPPPGDARFAPPALPTWIDMAYEAYGMPDLEGRGLKVGLDRHGPPFDPDTGSRLPSPEAISHTREYLALRFPALAEAPVAETRVCQYENTSNGDLLLDRHPAFQNVWFAGGGSGHGFKHGPSVGEYLAARILDHFPAEPRFSLAAKQTVQSRAIF
ncbi:MAG TPA: FAD-dependent oxidoreductase [Terriglobia bacterium]|nr:FAD-dependent oxidoreductase [Terriglobia bacterium]